MPRGKGLHAKTSVLLDWSYSCRRVNGRQSKLSEVGARMGVPGLVSQMDGVDGYFGECELATLDEGQVATWAS